MCIVRLGPNRIGVPQGWGGKGGLRGGSRRPPVREQCLCCTACHGTLQVHLEGSAGGRKRSVAP